MIKILRHTEVVVSHVSRSTSRVSLSGKFALTKKRRKEKKDPMFHAFIRFFPGLGLQWTTVIKIKDYLNRSGVIITFSLLPQNTTRLLISYIAFYRFKKGIINTLQPTPGLL